MKKIVVLILISLTFTLALSSCGSTRGSNCDAYGNIDTHESSDIASK